MGEQRDTAAILERTVPVRGLNVHVREAGAGTPLLLLHGFPQSSREWVGTVPHLAPLGRVIAPDLRGSGRTDAPRGSYGPDALSEDAVALLDALGIDRAVVVGHDIGALTALSLAVRSPERVSRLVVLAVPPLYLRMTGSMLGSAKHLWFQYALATPGLGPRLLSGGGQRLPRWLFSAFAGPAGGVQAVDVEDYLAALRDPDRAWAGSRVYRQLVLPLFLRIVLGRYRTRLPAMPTLVLLGEQDRILRRDALAGVEKYAADVRVEEVAAAGHFLVDEQPAEVARRIARFAGLTGAG
ncbi:epoxide hydrolase 1 [Microbacterium sp. zg.B48]|uniref:alpha/beta fold hydrolase n=1 Tax=unclassified Microbacterium TaxID=2609290 RepID=UPI00214CF94C|nr:MULTISPECIES: alpha/beta hydrolase [unclassified Microbacterium]MCR2762516.1 epoxide hydrolase 1 [Microbacterium sp. zg.B48]MCR2810686.1 epoxide hydrolase 1 [Microbacterium sp. zg.B185]WIM18223.1 alpha/beta hydrolase [Microbacterium sp. zg-B185]